MIATPAMLSPALPSRVQVSILVPADATRALRKRENRHRFRAFAARYLKLDPRLEASHMEAARDAREARLAIESPRGIAMDDVLNGLYGSEVY